MNIYSLPCFDRGGGEHHMPFGDGTGPLGRGPLTGRGLGPCGAGLGARRGLGRGFLGRGFFGRGLGGFGWTPWQRATTTTPASLTKEEQKRILEAQLKELETEKEEIKKALEELQ